MPQPPTAYAKAVQLLAGRAHFRAELATKLARRGYPAEEIEAALDRLTREGYLDDRETAMEFTAARLAKGGEGRLRLRAEMARRGVDSAAAEAAVAALAPEDDLPAAREVAARWASRRTRAGSPLSQADRASLARHLERKGFSRRAIVAVLKEQPGGSPSFEEEGDG
ncbi:MAG TPA: RecX family transcriptional regulator [Thermoanaerobaculia bacterium]|jgi:regulatory protein|nr:RecX family transcriptional regulator [Thermoanaerobaculia bacterium]